MLASVVRQHLHVDAGQFGDLDQPFYLIAHDIGAASETTQYSLVQDGPERDGRVLGQKCLPCLADLNEPVNLGTGIHRHQPGVQDRAQTRLELAAQPTAPGVVRGHVRAVACEWGLAGLADTAELLASELAANAVLASQRLGIRADLAIVPVIRLWLTCDGAVLAIHVWDGSDDMPVRRDPGPDEISGRGLMIIESLAKDWGTYREASGKVVWAVVAREALPGAGDE